VSLLEGCEGGGAQVEARPQGGPDWVSVKVRNLRTYKGKINGYFNTSVTKRLRTSSLRSSSRTQRSSVGSRSLVGENREGRAWLA
jgi:hypothetical protein